MEMIHKLLFRVLSYDQRLHRVPLLLVAAVVVDLPRLIRHTLPSTETLPLLDPMYLVDTTIEIIRTELALHLVYLPIKDEIETALAADGFTALPLLLLCHVLDPLIGTWIAPTPFLEEVRVLEKYVEHFRIPVQTEMEMIVIVRLDLRPLRLVHLVMIRMVEIVRHPMRQNPRLD